MNLGKVGIIMSGGGFTGAFSVGFIKAIWKIFRKNGIQPAIIQGASIGAMNAAKTIESDEKELIKIWLDIEKKKARSIFNWLDIPKNIFNRGNALYLNKGVMQILDKYDFQKIISSPIELQIVTCNESRDDELNIFSSRQEIFVKNPHLLKDAILASAAIPGILSPININGEMHSDGIIFSIQPLIQAECDTIIILLNDQAAERDRWDARLSRLLHRHYNNEVSYEFKKILKRNKNYRIEVSNIDIEEEKKPSIIKRISKLMGTIKNAVESIGQENSVTRRIIILNARTPIPTLHTTGFEIGDIKAAIEQGCDQGYEFLKKILD
ncbi:MAG: patatin-like phospholipase family protein [Patescibacteria group bacterium]